MSRQLALLPEGNDQAMVVGQSKNAELFLVVVGGMVYVVDRVTAKHWPLTRDTNNCNKGENCEIALDSNAGFLPGAKRAAVNISVMENHDGEDETDSPLPKGYVQGWNVFDVATGKHSPMTTEPNFEFPSRPKVPKADKPPKGLDCSTAPCWMIRLGPNSHAVYHGKKRGPQSVQSLSLVRRGKVVARVSDKADFVGILASITSATSK